ncbi:putative manganese-dependent inorganic diphosphatase [Natranaerobius thermophilus]|uniref:inorganic diphosphatase n=1 Tax=Natranaerobius thermophilus (strain ATCC BAA-1301 / DSM 18059 / JW/NM-WN-LF) TaxID=457570 RepID=B2A228_NATTJ|nr:putative manganese-dependent inorganic diphosphatase [Natranaerobius thermophilus]ACB84833.1 Inorganic diphosphatase [Natranaerobius thermophilus JW/NM-WN-LF]
MNRSYYKDRPIFFLGHKKPDTDSICSALAYSNFKNKVSNEHQFQGARAGEINKETEFVLNHLEVEHPPLIKDIHSRVSDMLTEEPVTINPDTTVKEINSLLKNKESKSFPVVDQHERLQGLVTMGDLAAKIMDDLEKDFLGPISFESESLVKILAGEALYLGKDKSLKGKIIVGAMSQDTLPSFVSRGDIVLLGDRQDAQINCLKAGAKCLILTGNSQPSSKTRDLAKDKDASIISVPHDTSKTVRLLTMATPVKDFMNTGNIVSFYTDDLTEEAKDEMLATRYRSYPVLNHDNQVVGTISRKDLLGLQGKEVVLIDHNESHQAVQGINEAKILEIIDHHKLGDLSSAEPIYFRNEPLGATATIIARIYQEHNLKPDPTTAGLLLAAILSDTVILKSPTCTQLDISIAQELSQISGLDIYEFGKKMFRKGAEVIEEAPVPMITKDFKEYNFGEKFVGIGQMNTVDYQDVREYLPSIKEGMKKIITEDQYDLLLFLVTDIERQDSLLLVEGTDLNCVESVFQQRLSENTLYLENVVSRKKQVVPPLSRFFSQK